MKTCQLAGRLGKDPEVRTAQTGTSICEVDLAIDEWDYQAKENKTQWVPVLTFGKQADYLGNAHKGDLVIVRGELTFDTYESKKFHDAGGAPAKMKKAIIKADLGGVQVIFQGPKPSGAPAPNGGMAQPALPDTDFGDDDNLPF